MQEAVEFHETQTCANADHLFRTLILLGYTAAVGVFVGCIDRVANGTFRGGGTMFCVFLALMALLYVFWHRLSFSQKIPWSLGSFLFAALLVRLPLFMAPPNLSDDYFRYLWDGRLAASGISPYAYRPSALMPAQDSAHDLPTSLPRLDNLYGCFNSPEYYSLYPPTAQAAFASAALIGQGDTSREAQVLRCLILLAELGSAMLLWRLLSAFGLPPRRALWYSLNPLAVIELTGNLHVEAFAVFFLLLAIRLLQRGQWPWAAIAWAAAIGAKLSPLWFLPLLWPLLGFRRWVLFGAICGAFCLLSFAPLWCVDFLENFSETTGRYYRQFAFNSLVETLIRWSTVQSLGYSMSFALMPIMGMVALVFPWYAIAHRPGKDIRRGAELLGVGYLVYAFFSGMVHPWYLTLPLAFAPFYRSGWILAWAPLSLLSYHAYLSPDYTEYVWVTCLQVIAFFGAKIRLDAPYAQGLWVRKVK